MVAILAGATRIMIFAHLLHIAVDVKEHRLTIRMQLPVVCLTVGVLLKLSFVKVLLPPL